MRDLRNSVRVTEGRAGARGAFLPPGFWRPRAPTDLLWDVRGARPVYLRSRQCSPGEDDGDVLRADAVQVQVDLRRAFDRSPLRRWERVGGPHRNGGLRGDGTGRACQCAPQPSGGQGHRAHSAAGCRYCYGR